MDAPQLLPPLFGGLVLGLTVFWNAILHGKVTGISGALHRATTQFQPSELFFISGLALGGALLGRTALSPLSADGLADLPLEPTAAAAVILGFGARVANGCTSGHALCGISRLSRRSIHAVLVFMAAAIISATLIHPAGETGNYLPRAPLPPAWQYGPSLAALVAPALLALLAKSTPSQSVQSAASQAINLCLGTLFAAGLLQTGMADRSRILAFLNVRSDPWDFASLPLVFVGALPPAFLAFSLLRRDVMKPVLADEHKLPTSTTVDARLVGGATAFGIGWGWLGLCPGPAVVNFGSSPGVLQTGVILASIIIGQRAGGVLTRSK